LIAEVISEQLSRPRDRAESTNATDSIDSFLSGFDTESVFDADPDENALLANDAIYLEASINDAQYLVH